MALLGKAALAMWWNMAAEHRDEFEHWHSHEHFEERMRIPGFLRGARWADAGGGEGFFVLYELAEHATLSSPDYLARLNAPTPWSTKMMPHHRDMVRSQCRVLASSGSGLGRHALTLRLSPQEGAAGRLQAHLGEAAQQFAAAPGGVGFHLLRTEAPAIATTTEQAIRGGRDAAADWIVVATAYRAPALEALRRAGPGPLCDEVLQARGAAGPAIMGTYQLSHCASVGDVAAQA